MTKKELGIKLARNLNGVTQAEAVVIIDEVIGLIRDSLINGENIYIRGFGTFAVTKRKAKLARNITANEFCHIPKRYVPTFKPCKPFKEDVNEANKD